MRKLFIRTLKETTSKMTMTKQTARTVTSLAGKYFSSRIVSCIPNAPLCA